MKSESLFCLPIMWPYQGPLLHLEIRIVFDCKVYYNANRRGETAIQDFISALEDYTLF